MLGVLVHFSFMLTPIDLVMVSKESSFKQLSNGMHMLSRKFS